MKPGPHSYEICIEEPLDERCREWFPELERLPCDGANCGGTLLRGHLPDQAALFGMLARIRDLNLTLLSVRRLE